MARPISTVPKDNITRIGAHSANSTAAAAEVSRQNRTSRESRQPGRPIRCRSAQSVRCCRAARAGLMALPDPHGRPRADLQWAGMAREVDERAQAARRGDLHLHIREGYAVAEGVA